MRLLSGLMVAILIAIAGYVIYDQYSKQKSTTIIAALDKEVVQQPLVVEGKIPDWLSGTFVRNGPIPVHSKDQKIAHWFDGPAMLHAFSFQAGKVIYSNKFLKTDIYQKVFVDKNLHYAGFASETKDSLWEKVRDFFTKKGPEIQNANVNVAKIAHQTVALTENPLPVVFDLNTLETLGALPFQDNLPQSHIFESAHPQIDKKTQEQINYLVEYGKQSKYVVYRYNLQVAKREVIGEIAVENPAYMHSFALTEHYIVLVEFPLRVNPIDLMLSSQGFIKNFHWYPEQGTHFIIIDRKTGQTVNRIRDKTAFFAFHHVNAFEKGDDIILDIVTYPDANVVTKVSGRGDIDEPYDTSSTDQTQTMNQTKLVRYILSPKTESIQSEILLNSPVEFPKINEDYNTQLYRYVYAIDARPLAQASDQRSIYKIDTTTKEKRIWQEPGMEPGEPLFIRQPQTTDEDSGVVVTIVLDVPKQKAFLLVLDGKTLKEIARSYAPHSIPVGLHGQFFKNEKIAAGGERI